MSSVVGLELPNAWRTAKPNNNVDFDISANQLNLTANRQMFIPGSTVTWPSGTLHKGLADPVDAQDAATKAFVEAQVSGKDELSELDDVTITLRAANEVLVVNAGNTFWVNAKLIDANLASGVFTNIIGIGVQTQPLDMGSNKISNVVDPTLAQDAATKNFVDTNFAKFTDNLSVFAATTSAELAGVISDETGSGFLVFGTSPTLVTPTIASFLNANHDHTAGAGGGQLTNSALVSGVFSAITGLGVQTQDFDLDTFGILTATGALGALLKHNGTRYDDFLIGADNTILAVAGTDLNYQKIVNDLLASGVFAAITGLGAQSQALNMNSNLINNVLDPVSAQDAATRNYVDNIAINGVKWKEPARVATTANITLSGEQTIDGILTSTDRVLVKDQTLGENNGVYVSAAGAWARSADTDTAAEIETMAIFIQEGTINSDEGFVLTTDPPIVLGTTVLVYGQFTGLGQITAGAGLTKTGNVLDVIGTTNRIDVFADNVDISVSYVGQSSIITLGTITTGIWNASIIAEAFLDTNVARNTDNLSFFAATTSAELAGVISDETGSGLLVFGTSPVLITPDLGIPSALNLINAVGLPIATGLAVGSSADLAGRISDETGTGLLVFNNTPTLLTPTIADFTNANHDHTAGAGGGNLTNSALTSGVFAAITGIGIQSQALDMGTSNKIVNLADPTAAQDAATRAFVLAQVTALDIKEAARVATTANITLSGEQTIDGVLTSADRVLVKDQTLGENNGVYLSAAGAWTRTTDTDTAAEIEGMAIFVQEGTTQSDSGFLLQTDPPIILGTTVLVYVQFTALGQITAGNGLTKTGNTLDVGPTAGRISVSADAVDIDAAYLGQTSIITLGTLTTGVWNASIIDEAFLDTNIARNTDNLSFFAVTTSAQLATVISDETGSGLLVFNNTPTLLTPTIASFLNAQHDHLATVGGGLLTKAAISDFGHNLLSTEHSDTVVNAPTQGSLIKGNGTPAWDEFLLGTALQQIRVNAGATDLEYFTPAGITIAILANCYDTETLTDLDFFAVVGKTKKSGVEIDNQTPMPVALKLQKATINISVNTRTTATSWNLRVNGVTVNQSITIPATTTGNFTDSVNTDNIAAGDLIAYQSVFVAGAGGLTVVGSSMESVSQ